MILDKFKLNGKKAIVTGGSRGLGQGIAVGLAEAGADVALVDVLEMSDSKAAIEKLGRRCIAITADLSKKECVDDIVKKTVDGLGGVDILFNNAGIIRRAPITEFTEKDWDDVMNINLRTLFFLSQAVARQMIKQGRGGKIVNTASMLSFQGGILVPSYTSSKSAVMGLTKLLLTSWAHTISMSTRLPPGTWPRTTPRPCARTRPATRPSWTAFRRGGGARRRICRARRSFWRRRRRTTCRGIRLPWTAGGWQGSS